MQLSIFRVGDWTADEDNPVFPVGSQPKSLLICPDDIISSEVIPGHKYIFKTPSGWQANQIWSEIIAHQISQYAEVPVPKSYLAQNFDGRVGALMEFFYGYPRSEFDERFVHGSDLLLRTIRNKKTGRPHGIRTNVSLCRRYGVTDSAILWGKFLVFDALIGNSDRHPDNWGLIWRYRAKSLPGVRLAPAFDNGTSLGYEIQESAIKARWNASRLDQYILRGRHHCGWSPADDSRGPHTELCVRYLRSYPEAGEAMRNVIRFDPRHYDQILECCTKLGGPLPFSGERAQFVGDLLRRRQAILANALGA